MLKNLINLASIDVFNQFCCWFILSFILNMFYFQSANCRLYRSDIEASISNYRQNSNTKKLNPDKTVDMFQSKAEKFNDFLLQRSIRDISKQNAESFDIPQECYHRYTNSDHYHSLAEWLNHKNASHYSPILPSYHQALLKIQTNELIHGLQVTSGASSCSSRKMRVISSSTPLRERAVCQFEYIINFNPNRIPSTFTEVKCSCSQPSGNIIGKRMFECEPLRYQVRVLLFDEQCMSFNEHTETIVLACIPVLQANVNADDRADVIIPAQPVQEIPT